jgi:hypothetical protein
MAGYFIKFEKRVQKEFRGVVPVRTITVEEFYVRKNQRSPNQVDAALMTEDLAKQVAQIYSHLNPKIVETFFHDRLFNSLAQVGEADAVAVPPSVLSDLENVLRQTLEHVTRKEVFDICSKVIFEGVR